MKKLALLPALLLAGLACEPSDGGSPTPVGDTDDTAAPTPEPRGVQIGSEGLLPAGCAPREVGGDDVLPGFDRSAAEIAASLVGNTSVSLDAGGALESGTLSLGSGGFRFAEDCGGELVIALTAELDLGATATATLAGDAVVPPSLSGRLLLGATAFESALDPGLDPALGDVWLVLDGSIGDAGVQGSLAFRACADACDERPIGELTAP